MKKKLTVEFDTETKQTTVTDWDNEVFKAQGILLILGNLTGDSIASVFGDARAIAEGFASFAGDEKPQSRTIMGYIKERMGRKHITANEALKSFEGDICKCQGACVCKKTKTWN